MPEYTWDMKGYSSKYGFYTGENLSRMEAERTLQLEPEPPKVSNLNDYIIQAQQQNNLRYLSFFLHHYERCSMDGFITFGAATATSDMIRSASLTIK